MKGKKLGILFLAATMLTGCGGTELTDEQTALVAQYAAGMLLKYDKNYTDGLLTTEEVAQAEEEEQKEAARQAELDKIREEMSKPSSTETKTDSSDETNEAKETGTPINDILKVSGFQIQYKGYSLLDSYPDASDGTSTDDVYFNLSASKDKKLLTFRFEIKNTGSEKATIALDDKNMLFKLVMPDGSRQNAMMTMLLNDLAFYNEELEAGETREAVVIFETRKDADLDGMGLSVVIGEDTYNIALQ